MRPLNVIKPNIRLLWLSGLSHATLMSFVCSPTISFSTSGDCIYALKIIKVVLQLFKIQWNSPWNAYFWVTIQKYSVTAPLYILHCLMWHWLSHCLMVHSQKKNTDGKKNWIMLELCNKFVFANEWFTWLITQSSCEACGGGLSLGVSHAAWGGSSFIPLGVFDAAADTV